MLLLTLRGTPTIYYGDEIGLSDVSIPYDQVQDPRELREPGLALGCDRVRTPMPWNAHTFAGFRSVSPSLPLHSDWQDVTAAHQMGKDQRMLKSQRRHMPPRRTRQ